VIRGTANYCATRFATVRWMFQKLDSWIRMRLRAMKLKRKNYNDNRKLRGGYFRRKLGLLTLEEFCTYHDQHGQAHRVIPRNGGHVSRGRPVRDPHAGKYGEPTPLRRRGGSGRSTPASPLPA
jgi:hypothetical protein